MEGNLNNLTPKLCEYIFSSSKRIRSALIFLLTRALGYKVGDYQIKIAAATELIHNATLIHDDVIDNSALRRNESTINAEFDDKLAVIAGDFLLSLALQELSSTQNISVINIYADSLKQVCSGEIYQYFEKNKIISIDEYIEKSKNKTAMLFMAAIKSCSKGFEGFKHLSKMEDFALNFGIAFQIRDDLLNVINKDNSKPFQDDIVNGIYTAPLIYLAEKEKDILQYSADNIILKLNESDSVLQTKNLLKKYIDFAITAIDFIEENNYKKAIVNLCDYLYEV